MTSRLQRLMASSDENGRVAPNTDRFFDGLASGGECRVKLLPEDSGRRLALARSLEQADDKRGMYLAGPGTPARRILERRRELVGF